MIDETEELKKKVTAFIITKLLPPYYRAVCFMSK